MQGRVGREEGAVCVEYSKVVIFTVITIIIMMMMMIVMTIMMMIKVLSDGDDSCDDGQVHCGDGG